MAISESARLRESLMKEGVPVKRLIVNQLLSKTPTDCKFCNIKRKVRSRSGDLLGNGPPCEGWRK